MEPGSSFPSLKEPVSGDALQCDNCDRLGEDLLYSLGDVAQ